MLVQYDSIDESSDQARLDEDEDSDSDSHLDSALDKTYVPRSRAKPHTTSPRQTRSRTKSVTPGIESQTEGVNPDRRITLDKTYVPQSRAKPEATSSGQTRSRTKSLTPAIESDNLAPNQVETDDLESPSESDTDVYYDAQSTPLQSKTRTAKRPDSDYESEPDEGLRTPRVSQRRAQRRGNFSPRNSETSPPTTAIYEEQPRTRTPTSASQCSITDKIAVDLRTNVSSRGSPASRERADSRVGVVPSNSRQDTPGQMDLDEPPQRETTEPKGKSSITHDDPQVTQETDAMVVDELEGKPTYKRPRPHASESKRMTNVLVEHRLAQHRGKEHRLAEHRGKKLTSLRVQHKLLAEKAQEQEQTVNERSKAAATLRKKLDDAKKRISSDQDKIKGLKLQVYQLQAQIKTEGEPTESSTKPDPSINKLNSRLEARRAEIEGLRAVIARNEEEIAKLNTELEEERASTAEITEIESLVEEMESRKGLEDAIHALELERNELRNQIQKERTSHDADLQHLHSNLEAAQEKEIELQHKVEQYRAGREQKKREAEAAVQELRNVHQERESAQAREAELMAEVEQYRMAYKEKAESNGFNRSVEEADKDKELRDELETLKIVHARAIVALEFDQSKLESQIEAERIEHQADLQNLQSDLKSAQEKKTELQHKVVRYRTEREEKKKEVAAAVQELENVRQERAKDLESSREKEAELMAEVERCRKAYKEKAKEFDSFNRSVEEGDKEKELRDELETLKILHARAIVDKSNELTAMHQTQIENLVGEIESLKPQLEHLEDAILALELDRSELESQIEAERIEYQTDLQNLQSDLESAQEKETELQHKVVRYRTEREEKKKEAAAVVQELENVRQECAKDLESARAKEAELMAEVERCSKAYNEKAKEFDNFKRMVDEADNYKGKGLMNELEILKTKVAIIEKNNESTMIALRMSRKSYLEHDVGTQRQESDEEQGTRSASSTSTNGKNKRTVLPPERTSGGTQDTCNASPLPRQSGGSSSTAPQAGPSTTAQHHTDPRASGDRQDTHNASPPPRQSSGTSSTASPQAGPSTTEQHDNDIREARKRRDDELERRRQADALARRRRSAMPEMRTRDMSTAEVKSRKPSRSHETIGDNAGRIDEQDVNNNSSRKDLDQPLSSQTTAKWIKKTIQEYVAKKSEKNTSRPKRLNPTKAIVNGEKKKDTPETRAVFCSIVRAVFLSAFDLERTDEYAFIAAASRGCVNAYNTTLAQGDGPSLSSPGIDMDGKISSPWNVKLIKLLAEEAMVTRQDLPELKELPIRSQSYYEDLIKDQMERARAAWKKAQPKKLASGQEETPEQIQSRLADENGRREKAARRTTRRIGRYNRRLEDVRVIISNKKLERADDLFIWKWLEQLILQLGPGGMSSDDTEFDCEKLTKQYVARDLPWRTNVAAPMKKIDRLRKPGGPLERARGATTELRVHRQNAGMTGRDPPMERSKDIFSARWLEKNAQRYPLSFSEDKFEFPDYSTFFP